jgi:hypothetical protein
MTERKGMCLRGTESFEAVASGLFAPLRVTDPDPRGFEAVVDHTAVGPLVVARVRATGAVVTRDDRSITSTDREWMHFNLHHQGPVIATQADRTTSVRPGELFACDNTRPYRLIGADRIDMTVVCVPRAGLGGYASSIGRRTALPVPTSATRCPRPTRASPGGARRAPTWPTPSPRCCSPLSRTPPPSGFRSPATWSTASAPTSWPTSATPGSVRSRWRAGTASPSGTCTRCSRGAT